MIQIASQWGRPLRNVMRTYKKRTKAVRIHHPVVYGVVCERKRERERERERERKREIVLCY